jgi:hypothetical protein
MRAEAPFPTASSDEDARELQNRLERMKDPEGFDRRIFTYADRQVVREGLKKLAAHLEKLPTDELPEVIAILETSARPLAYALQPVIDEIYEERGVSLPKFTFLKVHRPQLPFVNDEELDAFLASGEAGVANVLREIDERIREARKDAQTEVPQEWWQRRLDDLVDERERFIENASLAQQRSTELQHMVGDLLWRDTAGDAPHRVLFVDDYLSRGNTYAELHRALGGASATLFAFYQSYEDPDPLAILHTSDTNGFPIVSATGSERVKGFTYRGAGFIGDDVLKSVATGVTKDQDVTSARVTRSPHRDIAAMRWLRSQMAEVGKEVRDEEHERKHPPQMTFEQETPYPRIDTLSHDEVGSILRGDFSPVLKRLHDIPEGAERDKELEAWGDRMATVVRALSDAIEFAANDHDEAIARERMATINKLNDEIWSGFSGE